jgi:multisubunit Na+/H+ antiporter MnhB subunit
MKTIKKLLSNLWKNEFLFKGFLTIGSAVVALFAIVYIRDRDFESFWWLIAMYVFVILAMIIGTWIADRKQY